MGSNLGLSAHIPQIMESKAGLQNPKARLEKSERLLDDHTRTGMVEVEVTLGRISQHCTLVNGVTSQFRSG
jgi:hypothetical protein